MTETVQNAEKHHIEDKYTVNIFNEDDGTSADIGANAGTKVSEVVKEMYADFNLEHHANDRLRCRNKEGTDVFQFADLTIHEYLERGNCPELKWAFAAETGGA